MLTKAKLLETDGHGSGFDADLLDGKQGSDYAPASLGDKVNQLSNPNLLINGDFQVWQRGTNFTGDTLKYTADRWQMYYSSMVGHWASINAIRFDTAAADRGLRYIIDPDMYKQLAGQVCTFSCKLLNAPGLSIVLYGSGGVLFDSLVIPFYAGLYIKTFIVPSDIATWTYLYILIRGTFANTAHYLNYSKLELGSVATPLSPRSYAEELAMCKRYHHKVNGMWNATSWATNYAWVTIPFPTKMRITPSLIPPSDAQYYYPGVGYIAPNAVSLTGYESPDLAVLHFEAQPAYQFTVNGSVLVRGTFSFDAEIY